MRRAPTSIVPAGIELQFRLSTSYHEWELVPLMLFLVQVGVESCLEECQSSQEQEAKLHKATVDQTDRVVLKTRVLQSSTSQKEVIYTLCTSLILKDYHDVF